MWNTSLQGLGGRLDLPGQFYDADVNGCRGFCEWGFMSTTKEKGIALKYSGVEENRPKPTVLVAQVSSVDRGACISSLSQYHHEIEYLWLPCSFCRASWRSVPASNRGWCCNHDSSKNQ